MQAEALEIVERIGERVDLELAAVAGAGIDFADGEAAAEPAAGGALEFLASSATSGSVGRASVRGGRQAFEESACACAQRSWPE